MNNLYQLLAVIVFFVCGAALYRIRKNADEALAKAHKINAQLENDIAAAHAENDQLEQAIADLNQQLDNDLAHRIQTIDKERAARNESRSLKQTAELLQSLQPDLDTLCGMLLDAAQPPLDDATLLRCHQLAALGSANDGKNAVRYTEQLSQLEAECMQRGLALTVLTPASILAAWSKHDE
jgi:septal ring factor EnvC (AmiA/AmiB activator)